MRLLRILGTILTLLLILFGALFYVATNYAVFIIELKDFPGGRAYLLQSGNEVRQETLLEPGTYSTWRILRLETDGSFVVECNSDTGPTAVYSPYVTPGLVTIETVTIDGCSLQDHKPR
jgi:hypothetical protein